MTRYYTATKSITRGIGSGGPWKPRLLWALKWLRAFFAFFRHFSFNDSLLLQPLNCEGICCGPDLPAERAVHAAQVAVHG
jgi:hypothetical protein